MRGYKKLLILTFILSFSIKHKLKNVYLQAALLPRGGLGLGHHPDSPHGPGAHNRHAVQVGGVAFQLLRKERVLEHN